MNHGNVGGHAHDNGTFHEGGLVLSFPDRIMGVFLAFQNQRKDTDATGNDAPSARPFSQIISAQPHQHPPAAGTSAIYLERAFINPAGTDPGLEAVVLGNCATTMQSVQGLRLIDRNDGETKLDAEVDAGAAVIVALDRSGVQLGNNGGSLVLQDDSASQVDSVTYSAADASVVGRYVRFHR
jgi:hypothetical protein